MEELQDANMDLCNFNKQLKFNKLEIPKLIEKKLVAKQVWIESASKINLAGDWKNKKNSGIFRSK